MQQNRVFGTAVEALKTPSSGDRKETLSPHSSETSDIVYSAMRLDTDVSVNSAFLPMTLAQPSEPSLKTIKESTASVSLFTAESQSDETSATATIGLNPSQTTLGMEVAGILFNKADSASVRVSSSQHLKKRPSSSAIKARELPPLLPVLPPKPPCLAITSFVMPVDEIPHSKRLWEKSDFYRRRVRAPVVPLVDYHAEKRRLGGMDPLTYPYNSFPLLPKVVRSVEPPSPMAKAIEENVQVWSINTTSVPSRPSMKKLLQHLDRRPQGKGISASRRCAVCHYAPRRPDGYATSSIQSIVSPVSSTHRALKTSQPVLPIRPSSTSHVTGHTSESLSSRRSVTDTSVGSISSVTKSSSRTPDSTLSILFEDFKSELVSVDPSLSDAVTQTAPPSASPTQLEDSQVPSSVTSREPSKLIVNETSDVQIAETANRSDGKPVPKTNNAVSSSDPGAFSSNKTE